MQPLGFDWKMSISLLAGLPAKEIIISTMGVLYQTDSDDTINLQKKLSGETFDSGKLKGQKVFNTPSALAFLIFVLIYFPCIGVIATIKNESGHWGWALFTVFYTTGLAWFFGFLVFQLGNFLV
jgi:ferrous iron transport protein B